RGLPEGFGLKAAVEGQLANDPLVSSEQLSAGGVDSVRGYPEAVALGDRGVRGSVEVLSPPLAQKLGIPDAGLRVGLFFDAAYLSIKDALPGQPSSYTLMGTGLGFDASLGPRWSANFDWAIALRDVERVQKGDSRVYFQVAYEF
nr:BamA/TamA family outer membrane protein [Gammaproteobacteria bacterium]